LVQHIRRTQFITTYGPGSILEGPSGPRIIPRPDIGLFGSGRWNPEDFEISHQRMSQGYLQGARIFRLPSNDELGLDEKARIYRTSPFPRWSLCTEHWILYRSEKGCPKCRGRRGRQEAIRFVRACPAGHLDDVDWDYVVHGRSGCSSDWYHWHSRGSSLRDIEIECPLCRRRRNLGWIYRQKWPCSGRYPEREPLNSSPNRQGCENSAIIIQRQASNLYIPEIITLFTVPPRSTILHNLLSITPVYHAIAGNPPQSYVELKGMLENLQQRGLIREDTVQGILSHSWDGISEAIQDILQSSPSSPADLIREEFHSLIHASINGYPPVSSRQFSEVLFQVNLKDIREVRGVGGRKFRIVPISRLHTVIVQKGYRRLDPDPYKSELVDISFTDAQGNKWYPGAELFGEGIFIMLDEDLQLSGDAANRWEMAYNLSSSSYKVSLFRDANRRDELHPVFVWWHTLSHLLIRVLSLDSGYSSASIRERVYLEVNNRNVRGGIVLYTVQPGADGTLGGMISLVRRFDRVIRRAYELAQSCSNDPLCIEQYFSPGEISGASCYACLLISETSCEHRNMWLDRHILLDNPP